MTYAPDSVVIATPIGPVRIESDGTTLIRIRVAPLDVARDQREAVEPLLKEASAQLRAYFSGALTAFDLPLAPPSTARGGELRRAMQAVGFGAVSTYGALSAVLGSSARAVGQACRTNPFPIVVPCHRILSAGNRLGYYSAGTGPNTKRLLLTHENAKGWRA